MTIGQIVYNIVGLNGYTSTTSDRSGHITGTTKDNPTYVAGRINITNDLVSTPWNKVGIQAPSGSTFHLNNRVFYMGSTEVYELDEENIQITSLYFDDSNLENVIVDYIIND